LKVGKLPADCMKVLIAAAGTGGHIYPGIAVAKEILRRDADSKVLFVGTARGLERKIIPENGFQLSLINSAGLKNVGFLGKLKGLFVLPKSFLDARALIKNFEPDVVVGAGGYVSGSVLLMASFMSVPTLVMDSNALPGFTNRRLAPFITKASLTFEEAVKFFGKKGVVTGNPVRREFFDIEPKQRENNKFSVLIFGGSQGSRAINSALIDALKFLQPFKYQLQIVHQTGEADLETVKKGYAENNFETADVRAYIRDMMSEFARSDLIISRAGATTCAELCAAGKAAIMIPLPAAADDHQRKNAEALCDKGAARMILQKDLSGETLAKQIVELIEKPEAITAMETAARKMARRDAAEAATNLIESLAKGKS